MQQKTVCMFVYNTFNPDIRVLKEARSLVKLGNKVTIFAVYAEGKPQEEIIDGVKIVRIIRNPIHYRILKHIRNNTLFRLIGKILVVIAGLVVLPFKLAAKAIFAKKLTSKKNLKERVKKLTFIKRIIFKLKRLVFRLIFKPMRYIWYRLIRRGYHSIKKISYRIIRPINRFFYESMKKLFLKFHKPLSFLDYYFRSYKEAREYHADIFHAHDLNTLPVAWYLKKKYGGKLVYDSHELYTETSTITGFEKRITKFVEKKLIKKCDHVITVCDSIANELTERYGVHLPTVIMNCPEINEYVEKQDLIRSIVPIQKNTPIILYQGGYAPNRGLETLLESSKYFKVGKLVMMGWGKIEQQLRDYVERENLSDTVFFIPPAPQDELLYWSASADLGVIPYQAVGLNNYYSCPNKLFEYIAAGIPVAGSAFPEISKVINGNQLGLTFDPHDPKSIAEAVNTMLSDETAFAQMQKNARIAREKLNWAAESVKLRAVYSNL